MVNGAANQVDGSNARHGPPSRPRAGRIAATFALLLGLAGLVVCVTGAVLQALPRQFTAAQRQSIVNWEIAARWRQLAAGIIFPGRISYGPSQSLQQMESTDGGSLSYSAQRSGIAPQSTCHEGVDAAAAHVLAAQHCQSVLRATYTDSTGSYVVTVGAAVLPGSSQADSAHARLRRGTGGVSAMGFPGTASSQFTNARRQLSSSMTAGPYVVLYTVGFADARPRLPVSSDSYTTAEMTSFAQGVAGAVAKALAAAPPVPHCPGAPGC